jgi:hypothetical protein
VRGELLVAVLGVAGDADRADHLAVGVADQHAAALGEDLLAARPDQVATRGRGYFVRGADVETGGRLVRMCDQRTLNCLRELLFLALRMMKPIRAPYPVKGPTLHLKYLLP